MPSLTGLRLIALAIVIIGGWTQTTTSSAARIPRLAVSCNGFGPTPSITEGPYFKTGSPLRSSLVTPGMKGTRLTLSGYVLTAACKPVAHALLDFWQANAQGGYDNEGFQLRGHQVTDAKGRYRLQTVVPGLYPGRTRHIHVKVAAPGRSVLTTQLYFPGETHNASDPLFNPAGLVRWHKVGSRRVALFDFVLSS